MIHALATRGDIHTCMLQMTRPNTFPDSVQHCRITRTGQARFHMPQKKSVGLRPWPDTVRLRVMQMRRSSPEPRYSDSPTASSSLRTSSKGADSYRATPFHTAGYASSSASTKTSARLSSSREVCLFLRHLSLRTKIYIYHITGGKITEQGPLRKMSPRRGQRPRVPHCAPMSGASRDSIAYKVRSRCWPLASRGDYFRF